MGRLGHLAKAVASVEANSVALDEAAVASVEAAVASVDEAASGSLEAGILSEASAEADDDGGETGSVGKKERHISPFRLVSCRGELLGNCTVIFGIAQPCLELHDGHIVQILLDSLVSNCTTAYCRAQGYLSTYIACVLVWRVIMLQDAVETLPI